MKNLFILTIFAFGLLIMGASNIPAQTKSVAGDWDASMNTPGGVRPFKLSFKVDGEKLSGTVARSNGDVPLQGTIKGTEINFAYTITYNGHDLELIFGGKVDGDNMSGTVSFGGNGEDQWSAKRATAASSKATP
jgi:hypothetical protein